MQVHSDSATLNATLERVGIVLRLFGWLGFWVQLGLAVASGLILIFVIGGRNISQGFTPSVVTPGTVAVPETGGVGAGVGVGIFWAVSGVVALLVSIYLAFRQTRLARRLRNPDPTVHPHKSEVTQLLKLGAIVGLIGMLLTILGAGATLGVLLSKAIAQPQGVAIYDPRRIIRSLDIFVAMANMNGIAAHFLGTVTSLGLLNWLHRR